MTRNDYLYFEAFQQYLDRCSERWIKRKISSMEPAEAVFALKKHCEKNSRAYYVLYFLWAYSDAHRHYYAECQHDLMKAAMKIMLIMKTDTFRFNDYQVQHWIGLLEETASFGRDEEIYLEPVEPRFEEAMKFIYTFIQQFKKEHLIPLLVEPDDVRKLANDTFILSNQNRYDSLYMK